MSSSAITGPILSDTRRAPAGTAAAPSFAFNDSTGTGVYLVSAGVLGLSTNGAQRVVVDASGNVGIGTASPLDRLHVSSATAAGIRAVCTGATGADMRMYGSDGAQGLIGTFSNHVVTFYTNSTEKMRLDASGNLLVGTTSFVASNEARVTIVNKAGDANNRVINLKTNATTAATTMIGFYDGADTFQGQIYSQPDSNTTVYATSSDYRLKDIEGRLTGAKDFVMALQPKQGKWKASGVKFVGFLAHEFQQVSPTSVMGEKDAVDSKGNPIYQSMQASTPEVMANLIAFVQEQQAQIEKQSQALEALKAEVAALKAP
jgi:hypothetical protein